MAFHLSKLFRRSGRANRTSAFTHRRERPLLERLESRMLLASITPVTTDFFTGLKTVTVTGDNVNETWTIKHDGNGGVQISGPVSGTRSGVQHLIVQTNGGADTVKYTLTGDNTAAFTLDVDTGDDPVAIVGTDDQVTVNLDGNINRSLTINVQTRSNDDSIVVNANRDNLPNGVRIASGKTLSLNLQAGDRNDFISVGYQGDMDGHLKIAASGDGGGLLLNGPDRIDALVIMDDGSGQLSTGQSGLGTFDMKLEGNGGNDNFTALVGDHSGGNVHFDQSLVTSGAILTTAFKPQDTVTHTANVDVQGFQPDSAHDTIVSAPAFTNRAITSPIARASAATLSGIITEPDPGDSFFLDVNWGDGTPTQTFTFAPGSFVSGTTLANVQHTYSQVGHYHIRLTWRDQTGLSNDDNSLVVKVLPPQAIHHFKKTRSIG